nr:DUF3793 family protein [Phascolarctobacterium sp.]
MKLFGFTSFDELLAYNCAPVLAGIKPANLLSLMPDDGEEIDALLVQYNAQFAEQGIVFRRLCACTKRVLVLVYNEEQLAQALSNPGYQAYLIAAGYEAGASAEAYLHRLEQRLNTQKTFPHEIGVFLGYPLEVCSTRERTASTAAIGRFMAMCPRHAASLRPMSIFVILYCKSWRQACRSR